MPEKEKKKRGRRPKNNIIINNNPNFETDKQLDNLIVCLKKKKDETTSEELNGYSFSDSGVIESNVSVNDKVNDGQVNALVNDVQVNALVNDNVSDNPDAVSAINAVSALNVIPDVIIPVSENPKCIGKMCWNCCHSYEFITCQAISKYENDIFYTYGDFCSNECVARYLFETYHNNELWNKYSLLNLYYNTSSNKQNAIVKLAPNRLSLRVFGGNLTIEEYRENHSYTFRDIKLPPIIPINLNYYNYDNNVKINKLNVLKLYRTKPIVNKNNILNTMNIDNDNDN